jgi:hypothetical protein
MERELVLHSIAGSVGKVGLVRTWILGLILLIL